MVISKEKYVELERLSKLYRISYEEAKNMETIIRETYNKTFTMCYSCRSAIKHAQTSIKNFLSTASIEERPVITTDDIVIISDIEEVLEIIPEPDVDVDIEEAKKVGCTKCKAKKK